MRDICHLDFFCISLLFAKVVYRHVHVNLVTQLYGAKPKA